MIKFFDYDNEQIFFECASDIKCIIWDKTLVKSRIKR